MRLHILRILYVFNKAPNYSRCNATFQLKVKRIKSARAFSENEILLIFVGIQLRYFNEMQTMIGITN